MSTLTRRSFLSRSLAPLVGSSALVAYSQVATPNALRAFNMLVVGDSVVWGQGLFEKEKFYRLIHCWLEKELKGVRTVAEPLVLAHSDAPIFPRFDKRDFVTPHPNAYGETRLPNPSILFQASTALTQFKKPGAAGPENVDLIIADGGINDFRVEHFASMILREKKIQAYAKQYCLHGMSLLLRFLVTAFPNARIVVTGYFPIISKETDPEFLRRPVLKHLLGTSSKFLFNIPFVPENKCLRDELAERASNWVTHSTNYLKEAVDSVNAEFPFTPAAGERVLFVPAPFGPHNAYGAGIKDGPENQKSYLWELNEGLMPGDNAQEPRIESCKKSDIDGALLYICKRAAAFHPNPAGARAYADAIKKELERILPVTDWMAK